MSRVLVVAPHPDDETLGCGGSLLNHVDCGDEIFWWIGTAMTEDSGFTKEQVRQRVETIDKVGCAYQFSEIVQEKFPSCGLNSLLLPDVIKRLTLTVKRVQPNLIYSPFWGDVHSDHRIIAQAVDAGCKPMRNSMLSSIRVYETLSETEQSFVNGQTRFRPNTFIDISRYLDQKIQMMEFYKDECGPWPFPRSAEAIRYQAAYRGLMVGRDAAESFMTVLEVVN